MRGRKLYTVGLLLLLLTGACGPAATPVPPTPTPGPIDRVMAFQEAFNNGAVDEAAAMFVDDNVGIIVPGLGSVFAPTGVRNILDYATATGLKFAFSDCQSEGLAVNCSLLLRDDACIKSVLDVAHATARIKFLDGKINLLTTTLELEEHREFLRSSSSYNGWGLADRPDVMENLRKSPGPDITAKQQGELLAQLCKDWAAAGK